MRFSSVDGSILTWNLTAFWTRHDDCQLARYSRTRESWSCAKCRKKCRPAFLRHREIFNLAPATVRKEELSNDRPIALGVIVLAGFLSHDKVKLLCTTLPLREFWITKGLWVCSCCRYQIPKTHLRPPTRQDWHPYRSPQCGLRKAEQRKAWWNLRDHSQTGPGSQRYTK